MNGAKAFVLIITCSLLFTSFLSAEHTVDIHSLQNTPAQGDSINKADTATSLTSDSNADTSSEGSSQTVNTSNPQIATDQNSLQSVISDEVGKSETTMPAETENSTPSNPDSNANISGESDSQTVNTNDSQTSTDQNSPQSITPPAETSNPQATAQLGKGDRQFQIGRGVNYNTRRMQDVTNDMLNRDFLRFQKDKIDVISLSLYWYRLEGNHRGDYNGTYSDGISYGDPFLDHVKRFVQTANTYNLKVIISFHTVWSQTGCEWCTPDYVVDPETGNNTHTAIVKDEALKQAFLDMVNHTVTYLKNEGIFAWALLNEPWGEAYTESFINLIQRGSSMIREITGLPVTVRFISNGVWDRPDGTYGIYNHFTRVWKWDQRIFDALDFISLNSYIKHIDLYNAWLNITCENVNGIVQRGKPVLITEFGFQSDDDTIQAEYYKKTLEVFGDLPLAGWLSWAWNQYNIRDLGKGWNLLKDEEGNPRLSYEELLKHYP